MIPRNSTTRPPGVEERRRVEEQEEEQDHRKDPGFARPITLASTSSSRVGVLCEYFARFSFSRLGGGGLEDGAATRPGTGSRGPSPLVPRSDARDLAPLAPVHAAVLRRAEGCDANRTSGRSSLRAVLRKFYRSGEQI